MFRRGEAEDRQEDRPIETKEVRMSDGSRSRVTMHFIEGTRTQVRRQLMRSVDAFFELIEEQ